MAWSGTARWRSAQARFGPSKITEVKGQSKAEHERNDADFGELLCEVNVTGARRSDRRDQR